MGIRNMKQCCCTCEELLGVGTELEIEEGDEIRVFTTGGTGPEPFQGTLTAVEENTIAVDPPGQSNVFVRYCCAHITTIELVSKANG
jgi:molybdopterin biosynthesis enzyme MoaB